MTDTKKEKGFKFKLGDKELNLKIVRPSVKVLQEATKVYNRAYKEALDSGAMLRLKLDNYMEKQGLWDQDMEIKFKTLKAEINRAEKQILEGGFKLSDCKKLALDLKEKRAELQNMVSLKNDLDSNTAEGQATNSRFNYLVSACLVYSDNSKPYFKDLEDYLTNADNDLAVEAAKNLMLLMYEADDNFEATLPENKFLKKFGFVDEKFRLVNKEGKLTDRDGRLINEDGRYINEAGEFVDKDGNLVDKEGNFIVETKPFLDDEGNPILETESKVEEPVVVAPQ
jgi:hypothetical protein